MTIESQHNIDNLPVATVAGHTVAIVPSNGGYMITIDGVVVGSPITVGGDVLLDGRLLRWSTIDEAFACWHSLVYMVSLGDSSITPPM